MAKKKEEKPIIEKGYEPIKLKGGKWSYRCQITISKRTYRKTFRNIKDARKWKIHMLATREENRANGIKYVNGIYFEDLAKEFMETRIGAKDSTKKAYDSTIRTHLLKPFGKMPIKDIKKGHAITLQGQLEKKLHSPGGINKIIALLVSIIDFAIRMEYLERNPLKDIKRLKVDASDYKYWTGIEIREFLQAQSTKDHELYNIFRFALNTGLRRGEICGLLWKNVSLRNGEGQLTYNEQLTPGMLRGLVKGHSLRTVSLAPGAINVLEDIGRKDPDSYVFQTKNGQRVPPNKVTSEWKKAQRKANVKNIMKFHGARHSFASYLVSSGVSLKKVQQLLGHKDSKVTDRYSHLNSDDEREAVKIVDF